MFCRRSKEQFKIRKIGKFGCRVLENEEGILLGVRGGGAGGGALPQFDQKYLISRAISTQESGNLPYHVKTICYYLQKSV